MQFRRHAGRRGGGGGRLAIGVIIAIVVVIGYFGRSTKNPVTGQSQRVALSVDQEIALGLQSAPEMAAQFGGLHPDPTAQALVDRVGARLLQQGFEGVDLPYPFEFHLLADTKTVNAFALPGGQIFITAALYTRLETEGQLAGVLGHEIGHVIERHGAEHMAKQQLTQGLIGAVAVGATDPNSPVGPQQAAMMAQLVGQMVNMKYGRDDELESDRWGVRLLLDSGYDPRALIAVMEILREASGGSGQPEFMSTHPDPGNRIARIEAVIAEMAPGGLPPGLDP
jgi:predicted Zn-dependent protease